MRQEQVPVTDKATEAGVTRTLHTCEGQLPHRPYGPAIIYCMETDTGHFLCGGEEYESEVNYCPYCGAKAPTQVEIKEALYV